MPVPIPGVLPTLSAAGYPVVAAESAGPPAGAWTPVRELSRPDVVADLVRRYAVWLQVTRPAAGAACATQHYAGRLAGYAVGVWAFTGRVAPLDDAGLLAEIDEHGRVLRLVVAGEPAGEPGRAADVLAAVQAHLRPTLAAARDAGHITERLAWGGVATSVAGAYARALRHLDGPRRTQVLAAARESADPARWPTERALVTLDPDGCGHRRHTCCLIFLSPSHEECHTCPRHDRAPRSS